MALRDSWHRFLVYFGLADDPGYDYVDDEYEPATVADEPLPASNRRESRRSAGVSRIERRPREQDYDDFFAEDEYEDPRASRRTLRSIDGGAGRGNVTVHFVTPSSFNDAQEVADHFKRTIPVILNLQGAGPELSKRLIDFASGLTYALDGGMQKIAEKTFMLTPRNVEISAEEKARLVEKGFFNQS